MQATDVAPCLVLCAAFVGLGDLISRRSPFDRASAEAGAGHKLATLDGLRAYLALGVFFHHGLITHHFLSTGDWDQPNAPFYIYLGPYCVALFFMITSFLFWTKAIRGRASMPARDLLVGRVLRVGPMYLVVSALVYGTLMSRPGFRFRGTPWESFLALASPLSLGAIRWQPINEIDPGLLNAQVNWTLRYEWAFYLALPLVALMATPRRFVILMLGVFAVCLAFPETRYYGRVASSFALGMMAAHWIQSVGWRPAFAGGVASVACLVLAIGVPAASAIQSEVGRLLPLLVLAGFFLCVVNGNSMFGALTARGARMLGAVSYSFYLTHGYVLYLGRSLLVR